MRLDIDEISSALPRHIERSDHHAKSLLVIALHPFDLVEDEFREGLTEPVLEPVERLFRLQSHPARLIQVAALQLRQSVRPLRVSDATLISKLFVERQTPPVRFEGFVGVVLEQGQESEVV